MGEIFPHAAFVILRMSEGRLVGKENAAPTARGQRSDDCLCHVDANERQNALGDGGAHITGEHRQPTGTT